MVDGTQIIRNGDILAFFGVILVARFQRSTNSASAYDAMDWTEQSHDHCARAGICNDVISYSCLIYARVIREYVIFYYVAAFYYQDVRGR